MLTINKIRIKNLGPYFDKWEMEIPSKGVTIIHGENEFGKTSFYKIIRYLFFKSKDISSEKLGVDIWKLINRKALEISDNEFYAQVNFIFHNKKYILRRSFEITKPKISSNDDVKEKITLREDDISLSEDVINLKLTKFFPPEMRRFFMFDGVMLRDYIELVEDKGDPRMLKNAIEEILGMPIIRLGRKYFEKSQEKADHELRKQTTKNAQARNVRQRFEEIEAILSRLKSDLEKNKKQKETLEEERKLLENALTKNEDIQKIFEKRDKLKVDKKIIDSQIEEKKEGLRKASDNLWMEVLRPRVEENSRELDKEIKKSKEENLEISFINSIDRILKDDFFVKKSDLSDDSLKKLKQISDEYIAPNQTINENEIFKEVIMQIQNKSRIAKEIYVSNFDEIEEKKQKSLALGIQIDEILKDTKNIDEKNHKVTAEKYTQINKKISNFASTIEDQERKIEEEEKKKKIARDKLNKFGDVDQSVSIKNELLSDLIEIFKDGARDYSIRMKENVQNGAWNFYDKIKKQKDHIGLEITKNFGLHITTDKGRLPEKSGGAETAIALSLITSLHQNAAVKGPLIMDGPLQQMDKEFTRNVVKFLPDMSDQVIILAFEKDIDMDSVKEILHDKLSKQYKIDKINSYQSEIIPYD